jgi:hypothetical protein
VSENVGRHPKNARPFSRWNRGGGRVMAGQTTRSKKLTIERYVFKDAKKHRFWHLLHKAPWVE